MSGLQAKPLERRWWPVFSVTRPGLSVVVSVDRDKHRVRIRTTGTKSERALPTVKTITRSVNTQELRHIVGTAARLSNQFQRIIVAAVDVKS